jgi:hypothetical protein
MLAPGEQQALVTRLNRIEGQIRGIRRMVQEPRLCVEILQQLGASPRAIPNGASSSRSWSTSWIDSRDSPIRSRKYR